MGLQVFQTAQIDSDLAARAQAQNALFHQGLAQPGDAVFARRPRFAQFVQQLTDGVVVGRSIEHQLLEILRHEQVVEHGLLDTFGDLGPLLLQALDAENTLRRISKIPAVQHGKAIKAFLEVVTQFALVLGLQLLVLRTLTAPFLGLHGGARQDEQISIEKGVQ